MTGCSRCGAEGAWSGELCRRCWGQRFGQARRKYHFTPSLLEELRQAYCGTKREITAALDRLVKKTGWPRHAFKYEAGRRWGSTEKRRTWTEKEMAYLLEHAGTLSVSRLAKELKRSKCAVKSKLEKLELSARVAEGYSVADLVQVFGEREGKVRRWLERGLMGPLHWYGSRQARVPEKNVARFIEQRAQEYDLRRVDQAWFKAMAFSDCWSRRAEA